MRIDPGQGHIPRHATDEDGDTLQSPFLPDVQAVRFLVELAPFRRHGVNATKLARQTWISTFLDLFSIPGLYAHIIHATGFPVGNRTRERFPFITNNLSYLQVAVWIHDHGLRAEDPTVGYLEEWAKSCRISTGSILTDGSWDAWPTSFEAVEKEMSRELSDAHITFTYPPRAPSAHPRSWATASEIAVEAKRLAFNLNQIVNGASTEEEFEDIPSDAAGSSGAIN
jgi:hypothetical protein